MNDSRTVALKLRAIRVAGLGMFAPARIGRFLRKRRERLALGRLHLLTRLPAVCRWRFLLAHAAIIGRLSIFASPELPRPTGFLATSLQLCARPTAPSTNRKPPVTSRSTSASHRETKTTGTKWDRS